MTERQTKVVEWHKISAGHWYREKQVLAIFPFSSATLWRQVKAGKFPEPRKLSEGVTAWSGDDLLSAAEAINLGAEQNWTPRREVAPKTPAATTERAVQTKDQSKSEVEAPTMRTSAGMREALFECLDGLRSKNVTPQEAQAISKICAQITASINVEIEFYKHIGRHEKGTDATRMVLALGSADE